MKPLNHTVQKKDLTGKIPVDRTFVKKKINKNTIEPIYKMMQSDNFLNKMRKQENRRFFFLQHFFLKYLADKKNF